MNRTQYKIKNASGKYFNGFNSYPRFGKHGEPHESIDECKVSIAKLLEATKGQKRRHELIDSLHIVKEEMVIEETKVPDISVADIQVHNEMKAKVFASILDTYGFFPGHFINIDLENVFPLWDLGEFSHVLYIHVDQGFMYARDAITDIIKHVGAKRKDYKRGERTLVFKEKKFATMAKLHVNSRTEYFDLSEITKL